MNADEMLAFPSEGAKANGMKLRDYFAGCALNGLLVNTDVQTRHAVESSAQLAADVSYALADAMMKARLA